jgi:hypothetical protein
MNIEIGKPEKKDTLNVWLKRYGDGVHLLGCLNTNIANYVLIDIKDSGSLHIFTNHTHRYAGLKVFVDGVEQELTQ